MNASAQEPAGQPGQAQGPAGQTPQDQPGATQGGVDDERLTPGFGIRAIRLSGGGYLLSQPGGSRSSSGSNIPRWMGTGSAGAELGWRPASRTTITDIRYRLDQNWNSNFSDLNGMDHIITFSTISGLGTRWRRGFSANAESRLFSSLLFSTPVIQVPTGQIGGPSDIGSSLGGSSLGANSPLVASYFGTRRNVLSAAFDLSYSQSPDTTWFTMVSGFHQRPASDSSESSPGEVLYPAVTVGTVTAGFLNSVTRRTTIGLDVTAARSESRLFSTVSGTAAGHVTQQLRSGLSAFVRAGYSLIDDMDRPGPASNGVVGSTGLTGRKGIHTVQISAYLDRMDRFGLGAEQSVGGDAVWNIGTRRSAWTSSWSIGYLKVTRFNARAVEGMVARILISRRVARNLFIGVDGAYSTIPGRVAGPVSDLTQGGARLFLTYTPQP